MSSATLLTYSGTDRLEVQHCTPQLVTDQEPSTKLMSILITSIIESVIFLLYYAIIGPSHFLNGWNVYFDFLCLYSKFLKGTCLIYRVRTFHIPSLYIHFCLPSHQKSVRHLRTVNIFIWTVSPSKSLQPGLPGVFNLGHIP